MSSRLRMMQVRGEYEKRNFTGGVLFCIILMTRPGSDLAWLVEYASSLVKTA